jgi:hypothetical protein
MGDGRQLPRSSKRRTTAKDAQTGSVACKATLTAEVEGKNASSEISYSIEKSSDGKLVATVYGL